MHTKKTIIIVLIFSFLLYSCAEDNKIGDIESLEDDYKLPQGKSPDDNRIVDFYNKYGTYILYDFTKRDFEWTFISNSTLIGTYDYIEADPQYVGNFLDLLNSIWFSFYPEDFLIKYLPYKIFLTSELNWTVWGDPSPQYLRTGKNQLAMAYCSADLLSMTSETKLEYKNRLQRVLWTNDYIDILDFPSSFYDVSDYSYAANTDTESDDYARKRGFFGSQGYEWSQSTDWSTGRLNEKNDLYYFLWNMVQSKTEELEQELNDYPLLKQKYDILRDFFIENYEIDLKEIGDAVY